VIARRDLVEGFRVKEEGVALGEMVPRVFLVRRSLSFLACALVVHCGVVHHYGARILH